ncbi:MAG: sulfopyruvate decarboxylase subunit beta [Candidatus Hydrothermarchaeales archaeon]
MTPEEEVVQVVKDAGIDLLASFPCDRVKNLFAAFEEQFTQVTVTREEEGVGVCAGAALAGAKAAMLVQSSGVGNMINALVSLTKLYELPLPILISWRGVYKEKIPAQVPMGRYLAGILDAIQVDWTEVHERADIPKIADGIEKAFSSNSVHAVLMSPKIWEDSGFKVASRKMERVSQGIELADRAEKPRLKRYDIIKGAAKHLEGKSVICNLGLPCKELFSVLDQDSNFYMLGSMGLASSIGLGVSLFSEREVVVIDGDGSILMNAGSLATIAKVKPSNLTILAVDNAAYGSTGDQPTMTRFGADLEAVAKGFGFKNTFKVIDEVELDDAFTASEFPKFIHAVVLPGNAEAPDIALSPQRVKSRFMGSLT